MNIKQYSSLSGHDDLIYDTHYSESSDVLSFLTYEADDRNWYLNKMTFQGSDFHELDKTALHTWELKKFPSAMMSTNGDVYFIAVYGVNRIILSQKLDDSLTRAVITDYDTCIGLTTVDNDSAYLLMVDSADS